MRSRLRNSKADSPAFSTQQCCIRRLGSCSVLSNVTEAGQSRVVFDGAFAMSNVAEAELPLWLSSPSYVAAQALFLRSSAKKEFYPFLDASFPKLSPRLKRIYEAEPDVVDGPLEPPNEIRGRIEVRDLHYG